MYEYVEKAILQQKAEREEPYVALNGTGDLVGTTRLQTINRNNKRVDIGSTWLHPSVRGTAVNSICKYLLLSRAFETLDMHRVGFTVHPENTISRNALLAIGASFEGLLKNYQLLHGKNQDMCSYCITSADWPEVKERIRNRIAHQSELRTL
jgi:N-acetyltransferase